MQYIPTIGLEIHVELKTHTKMFCDSLNDPDETHPNINVCPVCMAHPGTLPVINREAIRKVILVGLALNGKISEFAQFERKNYFYPDLPKGYQISQYQHPLVKGGYLDISAVPLSPTYETPNPKPEILNKSQSLNPNIQTRRIRIQRVHLEEDTGRLIHLTADNKQLTGATRSNVKGQMSKVTLVDFNRAGIPLMELVTEPDLHSAEEARRFAEEFQRILQYLEASDADMEKGQMRIEANVSLAPAGSPALGAKVELKNINSFKFAEQAIDYEIKRQTALLEQSEKIKQETRGWDEKSGQTISQRHKEESHDYRYFPEPDLPPLRIEEAVMEELRQTLPELPEAKLRRFRDEFKIDSKLAEILVSNRSLAGFFEAAASELQEWLKSRGQEAADAGALKLAANYLTTDVAKLLASSGTPIEESRISPENFAELITYLTEGKISSRAAKMALEEMFRSGADPSVVIDERKLWQVSETVELEAAVEKIAAANEKAVADYRAGKTAALQFLVGQVMKAAHGANPETVRKLLEARLNFPEKT